MTDFKKGGPLQNSNIYATNRLFVKNPLFKKKKKKRAPGVYNPKAKFKYEDGGSIVDLTEEEIQKYIDGGYVVEEVNDPSIPALNRFAPGGESDEPPKSKKKPYRDKNAILPRWMPKGMVKAIQNTEVGISPLMSNEQAYAMGIKKNFTDIATTGENLLGEGAGAMGISNPAYGINFTTGLTRDVSKNKDTGWALKGYLGRSYDPSMGQAAGAALERIGQDTYDARWDEYNQNLEAYNAGTMPATMLYGEDGWDPEKNKPKYDGKLARGLGKAMQKSPLIGGLSAHYRYDKFKQPHGYKAAGEGEIKLDWDPSNNVGLGLKGGLEFYGGQDYRTKNYRPGDYKWSIKPAITAGIGTRPHFGANLNAGIEGLPGFMPKNFPGYFYGDVNYNQSFIGPGSLSANAGMKFPLNDLKQRRAQKKVQEKQREDIIVPSNTRNTTYDYGGTTNDYIEVDIPEEEIQWYIDQGYRVEPVTKLKKFIG